MADQHLYLAATGGLVDLKNDFPEIICACDGEECTMLVGDVASIALQ